jgi:zinc transporter ZupT
VAVAGAGACLTLGALLNLGMRALLPDSLSLELATHPYVNWALGLLVLVGAWLLVLRPAQRQQPLAWQLPTIVQVAALSTVLGTLYSYLPVLLYVGDLDAVWFSQAIGSFFTYGLFSFGLSVLVIWRQQRRYHL